ncbi:MAG: hypothetical protein KTR15_11645 [Phycisphaeraceae bacterium]|nr:hypothetical protein [Phycisphaeraceae bacterium]
MSDLKMTSEKLEGLAADAKGAITAAALSMFFNASERHQRSALAAAGYGVTNQGWIVETVIPRVHLVPDPLSRSRSAIDTTDLLAELKKATER